MTTTFTRSSSESFTHTSARYLASKVAADLRQMQRLHGAPSDTEINDYIDELVILLTGGYVATVSYGFKKSDAWTVALRYVVRSDGLVENVDDRPGRVPLGDVTGSTFGSYLEYSAKWSSEDRERREQIKRSIPVKRVTGDQPAGAWSVGDRAYSRNGVSLSRNSVGGIP